MHYYYTGYSMIEAGTSLNDSWLTNHYNRVLLITSKQLFRRRVVWSASATRISCRRWPTSSVTATTTAIATLSSTASTTTFYFYKRRTKEIEGLTGMLKINTLWASSIRNVWEFCTYSYKRRTLGAEAGWLWINAVVIIGAATTRMINVNEKFMWDISMFC